MHSIDRDQLVRELNTARPLLVEVLAPENYADYHLPRAINVPLDDDFVRSMKSIVPERSTRVVVYCQDAHCPASQRAAEKLEAAGYTNVAEYPGGKVDWRAAGLPVRD